MTPKNNTKIQSGLHRSLSGMQLAAMLQGLQLGNPRVQVRVFFFLAVLTALAVLILQINGVIHLPGLTE